ncbi:MAG TPA: hypothetical protein PLA31_07105 [Clostridia bacterium]|nr:hypothetical protein [Clostridia bacterium]
MKNIYAMRNEFTLHEYNTAITREDFEKHFTKTKEKVRFTFAGWDGRSYDFESRSASVYRTDIKGFEDARFIKVGKHVHYIMEDDMRVEKATGEAHPTASWLVDVLTAKKENE